MLFVVLSGFVAALIAPWLQRVGRGAAGWIIALLPLGLTVFLTDRLVTLAPGEAWQATYPWVPSLGLSLTLYGDGLSLLFALLICGVGTIIIVYASGYLAGHPHLGRFYAYILMFMASMLGLVLVDNVLTLYVFWELTSLSSYLLIGFEHERGPARDAALQALIVTGAGGLALLAGMILLGYAGESWTLSALLAREEGVQSHPLYLSIVMLSLAGICTKSAQMPFHFWLPSAMEAPTPVSAYLHSATMVKAGIYLLARLTPVLGGTLAWQASATTIGAVTMLIGAWLAVLQTDMKRVLAYATVSALGMLTLLLGLGSVHAVQAALAYLLAHALYKGALFLVAGAVEHETGTRDVTGLGGLARPMPLTTLAAGLAALSMAGVPPLLGFIGKELAYETVLEAPFYRVLLSGAVAATGVLFVAVAGIVGVRPFLGQRRDTPQDPHRAPLRLWLGPFLLAAAGLGAGLWCEPVGSTLLAPAVSAVLRQPVTVELALWHGWTATLFLSLVSVLAGVGLYAGRHAVYRAAAPGRQVAQWGPARGYERLLAALYRLAEVQTRLLQSGYLRYYLLMTLVSTVGLVGWTLVRQGEITGAELGGAIYVHEAWLAGLIVAASVVTIRSRSRLTAIAALGVVGYSVALLFVLLGAPDLAIAQFLIETLMVILFVLVLYHLPGYTLMSLPRARFRDAVVALTAGCLITALVLVTAQVQWYEPISEYFIRHSLSQAHGRNIVNVILVDFRGIDTLGEITVLAVAALGVYALLKLRPGAASETEDDS